METEKEAGKDLPTDNYQEINIRERFSNYYSKEMWTSQTSSFN